MCVCFSREFMANLWCFSWFRFLMKCANETVTLELKNGGFIILFMVYRLLLLGCGCFQARGMLDTVSPREL